METGTRVKVTIKFFGRSTDPLTGEKDHAQALAPVELRRRRIVERRTEGGEAVVRFHKLKMRQATKEEYLVEV